VEREGKGRGEKKDEMIINEGLKRKKIRWGRSGDKTASTVTEPEGEENERRHVDETRGSAQYASRVAKSFGDEETNNAREKGKRGGN